MKNFRMFMIAVAVCLASGSFFIACEDAESASPPTDNSAFPGTYKLTSFNIFERDGSTPPVYVASQADLNGDLVESQNLTTESACYGESYIRFNANHTYERKYFYGSTGACNEGVREAGVWNRVGDVITITASSFNGNPQEQVDVYSTEFTYSEAGGSISGSREDIDNLQGTLAGSGKVEFTYVKQ